MKDLSPNDVNSEEIVIFSSNVQFSKTASSINFTFEGIVISFNDLHPLNAFDCITVAI